MRLGSIKDTTHRTPALTPASSHDVSEIRRAFDNWNDQTIHSHGNAPQIQGRDFLTPALQILNVLEAVSNLHPIAKAVVSSFKVVVTFEQERRENDARVTVVFLAQTDMMRAILEIRNLEDKAVDSHVKSRTLDRLNELLPKIRDDILACGNIIDTYYKEARIVKYLKGQGWKDRLLAYVQQFENHRKDIQFALSMHVAVATDDMVSKLDTIMTHLFKHQFAWEKRLESQIAAYDSSDFIEDDTKLINLIALSDSAPTGTTQGASPYAALSIELTRAKISLSLDTLVQRNADIFQRKLGMQIEQLSDVVKQSAENVVRQLSGPHGRIDDQELRDIWKEMNWTLLVENSQFVVALREHYLDRIYRYEVSASEVNLANTPTSAGDGILQLRRTSLDPAGADIFDDRWALDYLSGSHVQRILEAADSDIPGFIRIGEANVFTARKPRGWNLAKWCAYCAAGWPHELYIYLGKIDRLLYDMVEQQSRVLPPNRPFVAWFINSDVLAAVSALVRGPLSGRSDDFAIQSLVEEKIEHQDQILSARLHSLKYNIDAQDTIRLLCGDGPIEHYGVQLIYWMLRHLFDLLQLCEREILDVMEFHKMWHSLTYIFNDFRDRLDVLKVAFKGQSADDHASLDNFSGGLFRVYQLFGWDCDIEDTSFYPHYDYCDTLQRMSTIRETDPTILLMDDLDPYDFLSYSTWRMHSELNVSTCSSEEIPSSWQIDAESLPRLDDSGLGLGNSRNQKFPYHCDTWCDACHVRPIVGQACFKCLECFNIDLCGRCQSLPASEIMIDGHAPEHNLMKHCLFLPYSHKSWLCSVARHYLASLVPIAQQESDMDLVQEEPKGEFQCSGSCGKLKLDGLVFKCLDLNCEDYLLCGECERRISGDPTCPPAPEISDMQGTHKSWHTLLMIQDLTAERLKGNLQISEISERPVSMTLESRMMLLEERLQVMDGKLDRMESLLTILVSGLSTKEDNIGLGSEFV